MKSLYVSFTICVCLYALMLLLSHLIIFTNSFDIESYKAFHVNPNSETILADNQKLLFSTINLYDLTLIPSVGNSMANKILRSKDKIIAKSLKLESENKYQSLTIVHGIGEKTARKYKNVFEW